MSTTPSPEPTQHTPAAHVTQPTVPLPGGQIPASAPHTTTPGFDGYAAQQYASPEPLPVGTTLKDTNTYALVSILLTFVVPLAGIIFGHMGLSQIKRTGDAGRGLALTAVIYGYCTVALGLLVMIMYIGFIAVAISSFSSGSHYLS